MDFDLPGFDEYAINPAVEITPEEFDLVLAVSAVIRLKETDRLYDYKFDAERGNLESKELRAYVRGLVDGGVIDIIDFYDWEARYFK